MELFFTVQSTVQILPEATLLFDWIHRFPSAGCELVALCVNQEDGGEESFEESFKSPYLSRSDGYA